MSGNERRSSRSQVGVVVGSRVGVHGHRDLQLAQPLDKGRALGSDLHFRYTCRVVRPAVERSDLPIAVGDVERRAREGRCVVSRVMGLPHVGLGHGVAPSVVRSAGDLAEGRSADRVERPAVRPGEEEHPRTAGRVFHRPVAAHRDPGDRALVPGMPVPLEQLAQLDQVEGLPHRRPTLATVPPVRVVPAVCTRIGHDDEQVGRGGQRFDVEDLRPGRVCPGPTIEQVQHGPGGRGLRVEPARQEQPDPHDADGRRVDREVPGASAEDVGWRRTAGVGAMDHRGVRVDRDDAGPVIGWHPIVGPRVACANVGVGVGTGAAVAVAVDGGSMSASESGSRRRRSPPPAPRQSGRPAAGGPVHVHAFPFSCNRAIRARSGLRWPADRPGLLELWRDAELRGVAAVGVHDPELARFRVGGDAIHQRRVPEEPDPTAGGPTRL